MAAMVTANPMLRRLGRGDRIPVLVLPGFTADDTSTAMLRSHLRGWGYWAHGWRAGSNLGPTRQAIAAARERLGALYERHHRPVVVIGQSAGGLFARHLAREAPDQVRQVITLGSPIQLLASDGTSLSALTRRLELGFDPEFRRLADHQRGVLSVPSTSVYTPTDGIVPWQSCLDVVDDRHENVAVRGTYSGLAVNPAALLVIADRLRQPDGTWRAFQPPRLLRHLYPAPGGWELERLRNRAESATPD